MDRPLSPTSSAALPGSERQQLDKDTQPGQSPATDTSGSQWQYDFSQYPKTETELKQLAKSLNETVSDLSERWESDPAVPQSCYQDSKSNLYRWYAADWKDRVCDALSSHKSETDFDKHMSSAQGQREAFSGLLNAVESVNPEPDRLFITVGSEHVSEILAKMENFEKAAKTFAEIQRNAPFQSQGSKKGPSEGVSCERCGRSRKQLSC